MRSTLMSFDLGLVIKVSSSFAPFLGGRVTPLRELELAPLDLLGFPMMDASGRQKERL